VIVEQQVQYTTPVQQYVSTKNIAIETALHSILNSKGIKTSAMDQKTIKKRYSLPSGKAKKAKTISIVDEAIRVNELIIDDDIRTFYVTSRKRDDLADCALLALNHIQTLPDLSN
jgi:uncharacterized protein YajQ (UPF0234 family)